MALCSWVLAGWRESLPPSFTFFHLFQSSCSHIYLFHEWKWGFKKKTCIRGTLVQIVAQPAVNCVMLDEYLVIKPHFFICRRDGWLHLCARSWLQKLDVDAVTAPRNRNSVNASYCDHFVHLVLFLLLVSMDDCWGWGSRKGVQSRKKQLKRSLSK